MSATPHLSLTTADVLEEALTSVEGRRLTEQIPDFDSLVHAYYRDIARSDLAGRQSADILGAVASHHALAAIRDASDSRKAAVRISTPTLAHDGWTCEHTVVEIVTDDAPFIVDSVTSALTYANRDIKLTIHPVIERNGKTESWLHIEIDRESEPEVITQLQRELAEVLADIAAAVEDWRPLVTQAQTIAAELRSHPAELATAGISTEDSDEVAQLLEWLTEDNFTWLGYREYRLQTTEDGSDELVSIPETGLGLLRATKHTRNSFANAPLAVQQKAREKRLLTLTKTNRRSTVHRRTYLDYIGIKTFDADGNVTGERRFIGLLAAATYANSALEIPVVRRTIAEVIERSGFGINSHSGRDLLHFCQTYPRDELFQVDADQLLNVARQVLAIGERRQTRVFTRNDAYGRFVSVLVYLPRDRYTTRSRLAITELLESTYNSRQIDYSAQVSESVLARLHFMIRLPSGQTIPEIDRDALRELISASSNNWDDEFAAALHHELGEEQSTDLLHEFADAFPEAYKEDVPARLAITDVVGLKALGDHGVSVNFHDQLGQPPGDHRLTLYSVGDRVELFELLPIFYSLGASVLEERPYEIRRKNAPSTWIYDVAIRLNTRPDEISAQDQADRFCDAFLAAWRGDCETDRLNALVPQTTLTWIEVAWLRSWLQYARQAGSSFSIQYSEAILIANAPIAHLLVQLFAARFDPDLSDAQRTADIENLEAQLDTAINEVASLDADRILRQLHAIVRAILRTNAFQSPDDPSAQSTVAHKLAPRLIPGVPEPLPQFEIWVSSPRLSGVHLRFGHVARGGLRWSDRPEDMRTEILGLVKAQMVKNAVIIPVGAKGGFVVKKPRNPNDRTMWIEDGIACYREFITALLSLTDNRVRGQKIPPPRTVRYDGDDPYLVVAADKGTASFSDIANQIACERGFWLGDAFASGGSNGYDHKAMGITARGAWIAVQRHFQEQGVDVQTQPFTVVGVGDMSGDVFGNAMLLSEQIRLVAAFDHRHIFLDPDPDPATSFAERLRLSRLERSSWADYDSAVLSEGGGIYPRTLKRIPITLQIRTRLGIASDVSHLTPNELITAILKAPVDLLFNGGIGTYVKAKWERNADVGDKANDSVRINGEDLRCLVVGEGGNLGLTQPGRIEAARAGIRLNTDAIDNSAGVDCSDHEVNIKIALDEVVAQGDLTIKQRNELLGEMTAEVADLVLAENYRQNLVLQYARAKSPQLLPVHERLITSLETTGGLDRALEYLPDPAQLATLAAAGQGLSSPELCVILSYVKIALTTDLEASGLADDSWFDRCLIEYFPPQLRERFAGAIEQHPLRSEIIATLVANDMVDYGGTTFLFRAVEETGAHPVDVARAYTVATEVFELREYWAQVATLDHVAPTAAQTVLHLEARRLLDRATRWVLATRGGTIDVASEVNKVAGTVQELSAIADRLLVGSHRERLRKRSADFVALGAPPELATRVALMLDQFCFLDIDDLARRSGQRPEAVAELYFAVDEHYDFDALLLKITELPRADRWDNLARASLRSDVYSVLASLTSKILRTSGDDVPPESRIAMWEEANREGHLRARATLAELDKAGHSDIATLSVALRTLRTLVQQASTSQSEKA